MAQDADDSEASEPEILRLPKKSGADSSKRSRGVSNETLLRFLAANFGPGIWKIGDQCWLVERLTDDDTDGGPSSDSSTTPHPRTSHPKTSDDTSENDPAA